jgi:hypothetical protein
MAEVALVLAGSATLIASTIYALKNVKKVQSCCCLCEQQTPSSSEQKQDNDTVVNFIKSIKEKISPRKATPKAIWGSNEPQLPPRFSTELPLPHSLPLPKRAMSVG